MLKLSRLCAVACALAIGGAGLVAIDGAGVQAADDPVKQRMELMKGVGDSTKLGGGMVRGQVPFDAKKAMEAMLVIAETPDKFVALFPEDSKTHPETEAAPAIWENWDDFKKRLNQFKVDAQGAAASAEKGLDAFREGFVKMAQNCKSCHEKYRIKKQ